MTRGLFRLCYIHFKQILIFYWQISNSKSEPLPPVKYLEGEVVWVKFNRRPWWPCHVIINPALGMYHRMNGMFISVQEKNL